MARWTAYFGDVWWISKTSKIKEETRRQCGGRGREDTQENMMTNDDDHDDDHDDHDDHDDEDSVEW